MFNERSTNMNTNELTTINKDNYDAMAKVMGMNMDIANKSKSSTLDRLKISHTPIMGMGEVNGKKTRLEVVQGGTYRLEDVEKETSYYSSKVSLRPFIQRFMYKKWVKPEGEHGYYLKTIMADNLNIDLKDNRGGFNCGKPAGFIKDYNALPESTKTAIKGIKRVRAILGTVTFQDIVDVEGNSVENKAVKSRPVIWEIDNRDAFKIMGEPFTKCANLKHLPLQHNIDLSTVERKLPNGNSFYLPSVNFSMKEIDITDGDQDLFKDFLSWIENYNSYIISEWTKSNNDGEDNLSESEEELVDDFIDVEKENA